VNSVLMSDGRSARLRLSRRRDVPGEPVARELWWHTIDEADPPAEALAFDIVPLTPTEESHRDAVRAAATLFEIALPNPW
jgi:hypothetical protein